MLGKILNGISKAASFVTTGLALVYAANTAKAEVKTPTADPAATSPTPTAPTPAPATPDPTIPTPAPTAPPVPAPAAPTPTGYSALDFRVAEFGLTAFSAKDKEKATKIPDMQYRVALEGELLVPLTLTFSGAYKDINGDAVNQREIKGTLDLNRLANLFGADLGTFKLQGLLSERLYDPEFSPLAQQIRANYAGGILSIPFSDKTSLYLEGGSQTKVTGADDAEYATLKFITPIGDGRFSLTAMIDTLLSAGTRYKQVQGVIGYELPLFDGVSLDLYAGHSTRHTVNPIDSRNIKKGVDGGLGISWQGDLHDIRAAMGHDQFTGEDYLMLQLTYRLGSRRDLPRTSESITSAMSTTEVDGGETGGPGTG